MLNRFSQTQCNAPSVMFSLRIVRSDIFLGLYCTLKSSLATKSCPITVLLSDCFASINWMFLDANNFLRSGIFFPALKIPSIPNLASIIFTASIFLGFDGVCVIVYLDVDFRYGGDFTILCQSCVISF